MKFASIIPWSCFIASSATNDTNESQTMNKNAELIISEERYALYWFVPVISTQINKKMSRPPIMKKVCS